MNQDSALLEICFHIIMIKKASVVLQMFTH